MANLNYVGSIAQERMKFRSSTEVIVNNKNELFNAQSIYVPKRFAAANIIDWDDGFVTPDRPAVFTCVVDNYVKIMRGDLLSQWQPVFRQDTNMAVIVYVIVFDDSEASYFNVTDKEITHGPLSKAFNALYTFSYFKHLFDPTYDGAHVTLDYKPGKSASARVLLQNDTHLGLPTALTMRVGSFLDSDLNITAGAAMSFTPVGGKTYNHVFTSARTLAGPQITDDIVATATKLGAMPVGKFTVGSLLDGATDVPSGQTTLSPAMFRVVERHDGVDEVLGVNAKLNFRLKNDGANPITLPAGLTQIELAAGVFGSFVNYTEETLQAGASSAVITAECAIQGPVFADNAIDIGSNTAFELIQDAGSTLDPDLKVMFEPDGASYDGVTPIAGVAGTLKLNMWNGTGNAASISSGNHTIGSFTGAPSTHFGFTIAFSAVKTLAVAETVEIVVNSATNGFDGIVSAGKTYYDGISGMPPNAFVYVASKVDGVSPGVGQSITIPSGNYLINSGSKTYQLHVSSTLRLEGGENTPEAEIYATVAGVDSVISTGKLAPANVSPTLPLGIFVNVMSFKQGEDMVPGPYEVSSNYWDLSLALAQLCRNNISLSWMWSMVKITYGNDNKPSATDACWIRYATRAQQLENMKSLLDGDRAKYYWAALYLTGCENTTVILHSEPVNLIPEILGAWFAEKNSSGTYIGNKLSLLRLSGTRIKPLGFPSWLDSAVNENDADGHQQLRDMNVGFLQTIADNTPQESVLSMARGVGDVDKGIPVGMQMIAKFTDYDLSQQAAKMVTAKGTLINPVLTDDQAYQEIQRMTNAALSRFAGTGGRLTGITLQFPSFEEAKVSRTAISAATAWKAWYKDDLDSVEVSGGVFAE